MYKNLAVNCVTKYAGAFEAWCYSSLTANETYQIPTNGEDTVNAGFNL